MFSNFYSHARRAATPRGPRVWNEGWESVGTGLQAGYVHGRAEGWRQRDVKRKQTWRMGLDEEHQAME